MPLQSTLFEFNAAVPTIKAAINLSFSQIANSQNKGRIVVLRERERVVRAIVEEARDQLDFIADPNSTIYRDIMLLLIIEGLLMVTILTKRMQDALLTLLSVDDGAGFVDCCTGRG